MGQKIRENDSDAKIPKPHPTLESNYRFKWTRKKRKKMRELKHSRIIKIKKDAKCAKVIRMPQFPHLILHLTNIIGSNGYGKVGQRNE